MTILFFATRHTEAEDCREGCLADQSALYSPHDDRGAICDASCTQSSRGYWLCTRPKGHAPPHVAAFKAEPRRAILARWTED